MKDVVRLIKIHEELGGDEPGRRVGFEPLNKSAIVLMTACWEAYIEDVASEALDFMTRHIRNPDNFPQKVRALAASALREDNNPMRVWELAGRGWTSVILDHRSRLLQKFSTPSSANVDKLLEHLLGLRRISSSWHWQGMSADRARAKLGRLVKVRGDIAHRTHSLGAIHKNWAKDMGRHVLRLVEKTDSAIATHVRRYARRRPWRPARAFTRFL